MLGKKWNVRNPKKYGYLLDVMNSLRVKNREVAREYMESVLQWDSGKIVGVVLGVMGCLVGVGGLGVEDD